MQSGWAMSIWRIHDWGGFRLRSCWPSSPPSSSSSSPPLPPSSQRLGWMDGWMEEDTGPAGRVWSGACYLPVGIVVHCHECMCPMDVAMIHPTMCMSYDDLFDMVLSDNAILYVLAAHDGWYGYGYGLRVWATGTGSGAMEQWSTTSVAEGPGQAHAGFTPLLPLY